MTTTNFENSTDLLTLEDGYPSNMNYWALVIHAFNKKWWIDINTGEPLKRNKYEMLMLMVSEVAEAMEGERKNLMDDKLSHRKMPEVEMADYVIRLLDFCGGFNYYVKDRDRDNDRWKATLQHLRDGAHINKARDLYALVEATVNIGDALYPMEQGKLTKSMFEVMVFNALYTAENYCISYGYDLWGAVIDKCAYNLTRYDHSVEGRKAAGGKAW